MKEPIMYRSAGEVFDFECAQDIPGAEPVQRADVSPGLSYDCDGCGRRIQGTPVR